MRQVAARLREPALAPGVQVLGPAPSPIPRLRGRYREQILLKGSLSTASKGQLSRLLAETSKALPGIDFQVDVDPVALL
jgi:primosomal protein N' (replication factor Y)